MQKLLFGAAALALLGACTQAPAPLTGDALVERGRYLVHGAVLCGDCHTPRDASMALIESQELQGGDLPPSGPPEVFATHAPSLAGIPANFTEEQFISFLQTGVRPDGSHPRPPMPPYRLNEEDARAVAAYIAQLPRAPETPAAP